MSKLLDKKLLLVFPPVWLPESPFLSTPALSSYLNARNIDVCQYDLNLEFWNHFYHREVINNIYTRIQEKWLRLNNKSFLNKSEDKLATILAGVVSLPEDEFVHEILSGVISKSYYRELIMGVSQYHVDINLADICADLEFEVQNYHDFLFSDISLSLYSQSSRDLAKAIDKSFDNPFREYFTNIIVSKLSNSIPMIVGISIVAVNQVVPAFTFADIIKTYSPNTHIVIGGSWCTQVHSNLSKRLLDFPCIDSMIIYEGEEPLYQLCKAIFYNDRLLRIPNLFYKEGDKVCFNPERYATKMNDLSTPDYNGLPLGSYDIPDSLPIQASRGCYWGKCTFCSYPSLEPRFKLRSVDKIIKDIQSLQKSHAVKTFSFTDALISPSFAKALSERIISLNIEIEWVIFARFEQAFTQDIINLMVRSGCRHISWGLESGSERILLLIDKSIELQGATNILTTAAKAGIHNRVLVMYGHPTETFEEAKKTIDFIRDNIPNIGSISYNYYNPEFNTPIEYIAKQHGISLVQSEKNDLSLGYKWPSSLSLKEKQYLNDQYEQLSIVINARSDQTMRLPNYFQNKDGLKDFDTIVKVKNNGCSKLVLSQLVQTEKRNKLRQRYIIESY